ncbi:MAG: hypothetical protein WAO28_03550 [Candidatus Microsaccharimonas sp.]
MSNPTLVVTDVAMRGETATITFEDGHRVAFEGYTHGWGYQFEGLRHFFLFNGDEQVVQYNSRLRRAGPSDDEHRFVKVHPDYPIDRIVEYWEAARDYLRVEYMENGGGDKLHWPWVLSSEGWQDLNMIKEGRKPLP